MLGIEPVPSAPELCCSHYAIGVPVTSDKRH